MISVPLIRSALCKVQFGTIKPPKDRKLLRFFSVVFLLGIGPMVFAMDACEWENLAMPDRQAFIREVAEPTAIPRNQNINRDPSEAPTARGIVTRELNSGEAIPPLGDGVYPYLVYRLGGRDYHTYLDRNQFVGDLNVGILGTHRHLEERLPQGAEILGAGEHHFLGGRQLSISNRSGTFPDNGGTNVYWVTNRLIESGWPIELGRVRIRVFDANSRGDAHIAAANSVVMQVIYNHANRAAILSSLRNPKDRERMEHFYFYVDKSLRLFEALSAGPTGFPGTANTILGSPEFMQSLIASGRSGSFSGHTLAGDLSNFVSSMNLISTEPTPLDGLFLLAINQTHPSAFVTIQDWTNFISAETNIVDDDVRIRTVNRNVLEALAMYVRLANPSGYNP